MSKKTFFNPEWTDSSLNPEWSKWLKAVDNSPYEAACTICRKTFNLSNMGKTAIRSHETSMKHKKAVSSLNQSPALKEFLKIYCEPKDTESPNSSTASTSSSPSSPIPINQAISLDAFVIKDKVLRAELLWTMYIVEHHISYNASKDSSSLFQAMFDDSPVAQKMTVGSTKVSYLVNFGLTPYIFQRLQQDIGSTPFAICFDEALNKVSQRGQMDLHVRYWSKSLNRVSTRYFNSVFLGHATAEDLLSKFYEGVKELNLKSLIQISMDGPYVNLKVLRLIKEDLLRENNCSLIDIGTCGLHIIHGAFKTGHQATKWDLNTIFRCMHRLFKDSPARKADYTAITGSSIFPDRYCETRWLENIPVAERAILIFPNCKKYIEESTLPKTVTVEKLKVACDDKLILGKMSFFVSVAGIFHPFLKAFQTNKPMAPFLFQEITSILYQLLIRFVKPEKLTSRELNHLLKIDLTDDSNFCSANKIDIGIAANAFLHKNKVSDREKKEFRVECFTFLKVTTMKIIERCALNFPILRAVSGIDPNVIHSSSMIAEKRMNKLLEVMFENNRITSLVADKAKQQFTAMCHEAKSKWNNMFSEYSRSTPLDKFYAELVGKDENFLELWDVIKLILTLSHGNAAVESGFSINKDILIENLKEHSLICLRTVYDFIKVSGGVLNIEITKELLNHARMARMRYVEHLEKQKTANNEAQKQEDFKKRRLSEIKLLKQKRLKLENDMAEERRNIDLQIAELSKNI